MGYFSNGTEGMTHESNVRYISTDTLPAPSRPITDMPKNVHRFIEENCLDAMSGEPYSQDSADTLEWLKSSARTADPSPGDGHDRPEKGEKVMTIPNDVREYITNKATAALSTTNMLGVRTVEGDVAQKTLDWLDNPQDVLPRAPIPDWSQAPESAIYWTCHPGSQTETWWNEPPQTEYVYFYAARPDND